MEETASKPLQSVRVLEALATVAGLLDRTINEVKTLDVDFQERLLQAVYDTETSLHSQAARQVEAAVAETESRVRYEVTTALTAKFRAELQSTTDALRSEFDKERERLEVELSQALEVSARNASNGGGEGAGIREEIARIETRVREIEILIDDHNAELSTVIRKNVERHELESYLRGMRFVLESLGK